MLFNKFTEKPLGRRLVIADVHGCVDTLKTLVLGKIKLTHQDQLFFLGDLIDRGPSSSGVLDFILALIDENFEVYCLRGNHEQSLLETWNYYTQLKSLKDLKSLHKYLEQHNTLDLLGKYAELKFEYRIFFKNLPFYFDLGDFYLVHAGFDMKAKNPLKSFDEMLWTRKFFKIKERLPVLEDRRVVIGHTVVSISEIQKRIEEKRQILALDNGCFYGILYKNEADFLEKKGLGNLCALDLDTEELIVQACVD